MKLKTYFVIVDNIDKLETVIKVQAPSLPKAFKALTEEGHGFALGDEEIIRVNNNCAFVESSITEIAAIGVTKEDAAWAYYQALQST